MKKETELNEIRITVPEGMEIDKENSTFECIKFKKKEEVAWRNKKQNHVVGFYIADCDSEIEEVEDLLYDKENFCIFATKKQAQSALAMAQISQIMANDKRFGGVITDEEWSNKDKKYTISRRDNLIELDFRYQYYNFLAFHTAEQRDLFLKENRDLVKQYLMLD